MVEARGIPVVNAPTIGWLCFTLDVKAPDISPDALLNPISIDTRTLEPGDIFWALNSSRDGHHFVEDAFRRGARAAIVSSEWKRTQAAKSFAGRLIGVGDTTEALSKAARAWRESCSFPVIGITGSNGKTSTKDLVIRLLSIRYRTGGTRGNLNNQLGIPLTLLALTRDLEVAVLEMGASFPGEIGMLCELCQPSQGLVTSISGAHLEGFGDLKTVAETKGQLYDFVAETGTAYVPTDDELCAWQSAECRTKVGYAFRSPPASWSGKFFGGSSMKFDAMGRSQFIFQNQIISAATPGRAAALCALAGLAVAQEFNLPLTQCAEVIASHAGTRGRLDIIRTGEIIVLDDTYNANPASMRAALDTLALLQARRRIAILGDMCELGEFAEEEHRRLGDAVVNARISTVIFVGELSYLAAQQARESGAAVHWFRDSGDCVSALSKLIISGDAVLVKASRALALEHVVEKLKQVFA